LAALRLTRAAELVGAAVEKSDEEKGQMDAEAIVPGAVIADAARRHDLAPQHLPNWSRTAKDGCFALPADEMPSFVPVVSVKYDSRFGAGKESEPFI
jgi:transposase-like protein